MDLKEHLTNVINDVSVSEKRENSESLNKSNSNKSSSNKYNSNNIELDPFQVIWLGFLIDD